MKKKENFEQFKKTRTKEKSNERKMKKDNFLQFKKIQVE